MRFIPYIIFFLQSAFVFACKDTLSSGSDSSDIGSPVKDSAVLDEKQREFIEKIKTQDFDEPILYMFAFNVGQGNFILLRCQKTAILVDAGSSSKTNCSSYIQELFEACLGNAEIKAIIITHPDSDHYNYLQEGWVKSHFSKDVTAYIGCSPEKVKTVLGDCRVGNVFSRVPKEKIDEQWYNRTEKTYSSYTEIETGLNGLVKNCLFTFLRPTRGLLDRSVTNSYSLVFRLTYCGRSILFTGDATGDPLDSCLYRENPLPKTVEKNRQVMKEINLLVMPHHGADTEGSWRWTAYTAKHSKSNFVGAIISADPATSLFGHARNWIRELSFPNSARSDTPISISYSTKSKPGPGGNTFTRKKKKTYNRIYITGESLTNACVFRLMESSQIFILNEGEWQELPLSCLVREKRASSDHLEEGSDTFASSETEKDDDEPVKKRAKLGSDTIESFLTREGYRLRDVPGDGNCGVWALLQAMRHQGRDFSPKLELMQKMEILRKDVGMIVPETDIDAKTRISIPASSVEDVKHWIDTEDFKYFAQYLHQSIAIIVRDPSGEITYRHYSEAGDVTDPANIPGERAFWGLIAINPNTLILYYNHNHYQAIVKDTEPDEGSK